MDIWYKDEFILWRNRGKKLIDQETNTQVYTKNLIIQEVEYSPAYDDKGEE